MIPLHPSDALQMSEHAAYHTRHSSNRFEKNEANKPFSLSHLKLVCDFFDPFGISIPSHEISAPSKQTYQAQGDLVRKAFGFAMSYSDISDLLLCIAFPSVRGEQTQKSEREVDGLTLGVSRQ